MELAWQRLAWQRLGKGIVRKQLFADSSQPVGILENFGDNSAVPSSLFCLISMILGHSDIGLEDEEHKK
jgi:hypothetical protein